MTIVLNSSLFFDSKKVEAFCTPPYEKSRANSFGYSNVIVNNSELMSEMYSYNKFMSRQVVRLIQELSDPVSKTLTLDIKTNSNKELRDKISSILEEKIFNQMVGRAIVYYKRTPTPDCNIREPLLILNASEGTIVTSSSRKLAALKTLSSFVDSVTAALTNPNYLGYNYVSYMDCYLVPDAVEMDQNKLSRKKICITGKTDVTRETLELMISLFDGIFQTAVSKSTDYLVCAVNPQTGKPLIESTKIKKAVANGIKLISEKELVSCFTKPTDLVF